MSELNERQRKYKEVVEDLKSVPMFTGMYDATRGSDKYMHGIWTVMEYLASQVDDDYHDEFDTEFMGNMRKSERMAKERLEEKKALKTIRLKDFFNEMESLGLVKRKGDL